MAKVVPESKTSNMLINAKQTKLMTAEKNYRKVKILLEDHNIEPVEDFKFSESILFV